MQPTSDTNNDNETASNGVSLVSKEESMASMNEVAAYTTTGDLSHFRKAKSECVAADYTKCDAMERLITSSKMYSMHMLKVNPGADPNALDILIRFMNEVYTDKRLIDDHIHFKEEHDDEIER
eukprot:759605_1